MCSSRKKFKFFTDFYIFPGSRDPDSLQFLGNRSRESPKKYPDSASLLAGGSIQRFLRQNFNSKVFKDFSDKISTAISLTFSIANSLPVSLVRFKTLKNFTFTLFLLDVSFFLLFTFIRKWLELGPSSTSSELLESEFRVCSCNLLLIFSPDPPLATEVTELHPFHFFHHGW